MRLLAAAVFPILLCTIIRADEAKSALAPKGKEIPGLQLMPPGSVLKQVRLPRYEQASLRAILLAEVMRVISPVEMEGENIHITLQNEKGHPTVIIMNKASYFFDVEKLISEAFTSIKDPRFSGTGSGLHLDTLKIKGFLSGPIQTSIPIKASKKTP